MQHTANTADITVGILTLGCPKNQCDSDIIRAKLISGGYTLADDIYASDYFILNTCGFIQPAKEEAIDEILAAVARRAEGRHKRVIVTGCLAARYKDELAAQFPEVDAVVGLSADVVGVINTFDKSHAELSALTYIDSKLEIEAPRAAAGGAFAYLRIADGCDNRCTYCAIPTFRGGYRSREIDSIVAEARGLAGDGVRELVLVAQDVTAYGHDIHTDICSLLRELVNNLPPTIWLRLMYCYPERITDDLIALIRDTKQIVSYIDLPIQHVCGEVLRRMNRTGDEASLTALITKLRREIPDIALRTTFIAGFPGETHEQWQTLAEFAYKTRFTHAGTFAYSREEGTAAADFPKQVDEREKRRRADVLDEQQAMVKAEYLALLCGKTVDVLVERISVDDDDDGDARVCAGRGYMSAPEVDFYIVFEDARGSCRVGDFVSVLITKHDGETLFGDVRERDNA